ncbi:hypothetical protein SODALDRAFT_127805 [Sodiomyces alkalinus F11]|uniref:Uncharacterized protein n=1 Tax=Sodiomyces alkalinus (strain CBS 110278 / VKM F-3762 / F11) TaxID=1314773 RepID=A0A3N2Q525_SODAK|nr:hypothetical protein SODALDRAFT_127805 [Sodiomyces alkalinus F11]ROT41725.1 hypothetical protein SODALDRAFT_127805 [Sodiomyces alkalinus F11]
MRTKRCVRCVVSISTASSCLPCAFPVPPTSKSLYKAAIRPCRRRCISLQSPISRGSGGPSSFTHGLLLFVIYSPREARPGNGSTYRSSGNPCDYRSNGGRRGSRRNAPGIAPTKHDHKDLIVG